MISGEYRIRDNTDTGDIFASRLSREAPFMDYAVLDAFTATGQGSGSNQEEWRVIATCPTRVPAAGGRNIEVRAVVTCIDFTPA